MASLNIAIINNSRRYAMRVTFLLGFATALSPACVAATITHQLVINPIQVCSTDGTVCSNDERQLFLEETDKIWSQAGIDIKFLDWKVWNNSNKLSVNSTSDLSNASGNQAMGGDVINMWFVQSANGAFGFANGRNIAIADSVFSYSGGAGRRDTIGHEIGHSLGRPHTDGSDELNLMAPGGDRLPATSIGQIFPDGSMRDQLTQNQISSVLNSGLLELLNFSILGDANLDNVVDQIDIDFFITGWLKEFEDPGLASWQAGDFNLDGIVDLLDVYILYNALPLSAQDSLSNALNSMNVPEPGALVLFLATILGFSMRRKR